MKLRHIVQSWIPWLWRRGREADLERELRDHLDLEAEEHQEAGLSPEEAAYAARRALGNEVKIREDVRAAWGFQWLETLLQDVRYALRMLRRSPGFTAVAVITLALGIGANTAIFSLIDAVMLKMLPVQDPQELVLLDWGAYGWPKGILHSLAAETEFDKKTGLATTTGFAYQAYERIRDRNRSLAGVLALAANASQLNLVYKGDPERADAELVSGTFFSTLGVKPILGRAINPEDDRTGANPAAVISYGYWQRRFGGDSAVVGQAITVNGVPFTIVGVGPPEFYGVQTGRAVEVWLPLHTQPQVSPQWSPRPPQSSSATRTPPVASLFEARDNWWLQVMGRLKPGVTQEQARAELEVIFQQSIATDVKPSTKPELIPHLGLESGSEGLNDLRRDFSKPLFILMAVVALVLLIACANVANLLLARAASRQKEVAVRLAIGAGRRRLVRQLLTESVLLGTLGGLVGLILAYWATRLLVAFMAGGGRELSLIVTPDPRVLGFTAAVALLAGILFGLSPALGSTHVDLTPALKEGAGSAACNRQGGRGLRWGLSQTLVVLQVALSLLLLVGAGLFVRTLTNLQDVRLGFDPQNVLLFGIDPTQDGYKGERLVEFYQELTRRLEVLPGVRSVTMSWNTLINGGLTVDGVNIQGFTPKPGQDAQAETDVNEVGPKFFETMRIPVVLGRGIGERDVAGAPKVAVVNQKFARLYLGEGNPLGRRFGFGDEKTSGEIEIVGVVADAKYEDLRHEVPPTVYVPSLQEIKFPLGAINFAVRTVGDPMAVAPAVRHVARDIDPNLAIYRVRTEAEQIDRAVFLERLFARLTTLFGLLALLLASVGVYGILAFAVTQRTREIGIRMALGAKRGNILGMVLGGAFTHVALGLAIGIPAALAGGRLLSAELYGVKAHDPLIIGLAAVTLAACALIACLIPARRATKVDPMTALRWE